MKIEEYINRLDSQIDSCIYEFYIYKDYLKNTDEFGKNQLLFIYKKRCYFFTFIIDFCKIIDGDSRTFSLRNILKDLSKKSQCFSKEALIGRKLKNNKNRDYISYIINSYSTKTQHHNKNFFIDLNKEFQTLQKKEVVETLKELRNNFIAHNNKEFFLNDKSLYIDYSEIENVLIKLKNIVFGTLWELFHNGRIITYDKKYLLKIQEKIKN